MESNICFSRLFGYLCFSIYLPDDFFLLPPTFQHKRLFFPLLKYSRQTNLLWFIDYFSFWPLPPSQHDNTDVSRQRISHEADVARWKQKECQCPVSSGTLQPSVWVFLLCFEMLYSTNSRDLLFDFRVRWRRARSNPTDSPLKFNCLYQCDVRISLLCAEMSDRNVLQEDTFCFYPLRTFRSLCCPCAHSSKDTGTICTVFVYSFWYILLIAYIYTYRDPFKSPIT